MLTKLKLTNFRRHRDLTIDFTAGINVMRAGNEQGKSTCLEAVNYALFGARVLRNALEETVTWDEDVKTLKVAATFVIDGQTYHFSRGKSGAEVALNGEVYVTGQNEVSAFAAKLFSADAGAAGKLMMASQNGIRGALDEGPKALSVLIEELSDMSVFDTILENASQKLTLGSPALIEERMKGAESTLEAATKNLPPEPDAAAHEAAVKDMDEKAAAMEASVPELQRQFAEIDATWKKYGDETAERRRLIGAVEQYEHALEQAEKQVAALTGPAAVVVVDNREALKAQIADAENHQTRLIAHRIFRNLPDGERYAGGFAGYEAEVAKLEADKRAAETALQSINTELRVTAAKRINHEKCDKCGQDVTHLAQVIETNAAVDAELARLNALKPDAEARVEALKAACDKLGAYRRFDSRLQAEIGKLNGYVELDTSVYPALVKWVGSAPDAGPGLPDVMFLNKQLQEVEQQIKDVAAAKAKLDLAVEQLGAARARVASAKEAVAGFQGATDEMHNAAFEARDKAAKVRDSVDGDAYMLRCKIKLANTEFATAKGQWESAVARVSESRRVIAECKSELDQIGWNNAFVKKLRAIRPMVADKVWNTVLASVSAMFSQMRGEPSVVTKGKDGFACNGRPIESLSGSTLDILGIALRCALIRTFVPGCGILVLDEPAQGCEESRTEAMLGFLQTLGMAQILLVTHETVSTSVADNIIEL